LAADIRALSGLSKSKILTVQSKEVALAGQTGMRNFLLVGLLIALLALGLAIGLAALIVRRDVARLSGIVRTIGGTEHLN